MFGRKEFERLVASIGLDGWTTDELRHSAASLMSDAGMDSSMVSGGTVLETVLCSGAESTSGRSPRRPRERGLP